MDSINSLPTLVLNQAERWGSRPALRWKQHGWWQDYSWHDLAERMLAIASALVAEGVQPGARVGLWSENRVEWILTDLGILAAGAVCVPAHAPLPAPQVIQQMEHAEVQVVFVSTPKMAEAVREWAAHPPVRKVICFSDAGPGVESWHSFLTRGWSLRQRQFSELTQRLAGLSRDTLATIMYTSGTTGQSKGVMLTHGNLLSNALAMLASLHLGPHTVVLSWLPYSHIYGRLVDYYLSLAGGFLLVLAESVDTIVDDLQQVQPTSFAAVPRVYEKILAFCRDEDPERQRHRLRTIFGSRIERLNSGGAPLSVAVAQAYWEAGLPLLQGYGLTETSPVVSFNRLEHNKLGTVGQAVPGVEIRIAEDGEILVRGPNVTPGYWRNPEATEQALAGGWFHTGDLGFLDEEGFLTITGRKKDLLVLSNGKKVIPTDLENLLVSSPHIEQAVVYGEGRSYLTALIVPRAPTLHQLAQEHSLAHLSLESLTRHPVVMEFFRQELDRLLINQPPWEQIRQFVLLPRPFSVEAEELTVSLKIRRHFVFEKYRHLLEALYSS
ncbi:MAG: long-chain fatty acid--CoA ligase [Gemmatales bacterium]|nr:long-chain fatty acid--CoA ligase [Gemmatales bacterium]MDW7993162.1 long-chain fatty acid--CoA ligase [Gemmatales bacterium]